MTDDDYSDTAEAQLDEIEAGQDPDLYASALYACRIILETPSRARELSRGVRSNGRTYFCLAVVNHRPWKVFWSIAGPRIEAVFPYP